MAAKSISTGSYGASHCGAQAAINISTIIKKPTAPKGCFLAKRITLFIFCASFVQNPWIQYTIQPIHQQIDGDEHYCDQHHQSLKQIEIIMRHGIYKQPADAV